MWMCANVCVHELRFLAREKMAYLEDALEMRRWNRHAVAGIRDLRDEAAILAQRFCQAQSRSGGAVCPHLLQNALIVGDGGGICDGTGWSLFHAICSPFGLGPR